MKIKHLNNSGLTLMEVVVSVGLMGIVLQFLPQMLVSSMKLERGFTDKTQLHQELITGLQTLKRIGRSANQCARVMASGQPTLQCSGIYFSDVEEPVRFAVVEGALAFQRMPAPNTWATVRSYPGVIEMRICGDTEVFTGTCDIPDTMPLTPDPTANTFYRVWLRGKVSDFEASYRSAFAVRNTLALGPGFSVAAENLNQ